MSEPISKADAEQYLRRFELLAARQPAPEALTLEQKRDDLERLIGWRQSLDDDAPVRERWAKLRQRLAEK
jgi:hypothetical protein